MSSGGHGITNILPSWLALIWALVFVAIFIVHAATRARAPVSAGSGTPDTC
jgi:hypothetical protein